MREDYESLLKKEEKIKHTEEEVIGYFSSRWRDFDTNGVYEIYGFAVNDKNKFTYIGFFSSGQILSLIHI